MFGASVFSDLQHVKRIITRIYIDCSYVGNRVRLQAIVGIIYGFAHLGVTSYRFNSLVCKVVTVGV